MTGREIRLVLFDLDGTLTTINSAWRYLHEQLGTWDRGKVAAQLYKRGEISYKRWAEMDAQCWAGVPIEKLDRIVRDIPYRDGALETFNELRRNNVFTGIISAGLSTLTDKAAKELGADLALSNELENSNALLTGRVRVRVKVDNKKEVFKQTAQKFGVPLTEVALVGNQVNDLEPRECLKIAFKPKDDLAGLIADFVVENDDLRTILQYLLPESRRMS